MRFMVMDRIAGPGRTNALLPAQGGRLLHFVVLDCNARGAGPGKIYASARERETA